MTLDLGIVKPGSTLYIPWASFAAATGAPSAMTNLAVGDIKIFKDGSVTERGTTTGFTLLDTDGQDFDGLTGINAVSIDLSSDATAGFYAAGSRYFVVIGDVTIDTQTVRFVAAQFTIGLPGAVLSTTIATLASQTSFTLTVGPAEDDALNGCVVYIHDVASAVQGGYATVLDYTGSTKTVTLLAGTTFTAAATDNIMVMPPVGVTYIKPDTITATSIAAAALTSAEISSSFIAAVRSVASGTSDSGTTTTMVDAARTEADTDYWKGDYIVFTSGTILGQTRLITGFTPGTDTITFTPATTQTVGTQTYEIMPAAMVDLAQINGVSQTATLDTIKTETASIQTDTNDLQTRVPAALVSGRIDASVGAMAADVVTAAAIATGAIDADAIADNAIDAGAIAANAITAAKLDPDVTTELQNGLATAAALATVQSDTDNIQTRLPAALTAGGNMKSDLLALNGFTQAAERFSLSTFSIGTGLVNVGSTTTVIEVGIISPEPSVADQLKDRWLIFGADTATTANLRGQAVKITANTTGATPTITVSPALTDAPGLLDTFTIQGYAPAASVDAGDVADAVWDASLAAHQDAGSTGEALGDASSAGDPWNTALPAAYGAGTAGKIIGDNINATISSRASQASVDTVDTVVDAILVDTGTTLDGKIDTIDAVVDAILVDTGITLDGKIDTIDTVVDAILVDTGTTLDAALAVVDANVDAILVDTGTTLDARIPAALTATGGMQSDVMAINESANAAVQLGESADTIVSAICDTGSTTTDIIVKAWSLTPTVDDQLKGRVVIFKPDTSITAPLRVQATRITAFDFATMTLTVVALTDAPAEDDEFIIV